MSFAYRHDLSLERIHTALSSTLNHPSILTEVLKGQDAMGSKLVKIRAKEMTQRGITSVKLKDFEMFLRPDDGMISGHIYEFHDYEPYATRVFNQTVKSATVFDVGANLGWYSLNAATHGARAVHAVEPSRTNMELLLASAVRNGLYIISHLCALGEKEGTIRLYLQDDCNSGSASAITTSKHYFDVPCTTLKALGARPDVLKIDVEDAEDLVLMGGLDLIGEAPEIFMEYGRKWDGKLAELLEEKYRLEILMWNHSVPIKKLSECKRVENVHLSLRR